MINPQNSYIEYRNSHSGNILIMFYRIYDSKKQLMDFSAMEYPYKIQGLSINQSPRGVYSKGPAKFFEYI